MQIQFTQNSYQSQVPDQATKLQSQRPELLINYNFKYDNEIQISTIFPSKKG